MPNLSCRLWAVAGVILAQQPNVVPQQGAVCTPDKRGRRTLMIDNYEGRRRHAYRHQAVGLWPAPARHRRHPWLGALFRKRSLPVRAR